MIVPRAFAAELAPVVDEHAAHDAPVARADPVVECLVGEALGGEPDGGPPVLLAPRRVAPARQLRAQQVGEQRVVAEPAAVTVERDDERVSAHELLEPQLSRDAAGQRVCERTAHPIDDRGSQQQLAHRSGLTVEHLLIRYETTAWSSPANSETAAAGSASSASMRAASLSPAAHPSVRSTRLSTCSR